MSSRSLGDMEGRHAGVTASVKGTGSWMEVMRMSADVTRCHAMSCDAWSVMMAMSLL